MERFPCGVDGPTERELIERALAGDCAAWRYLSAELWQCVILPFLWVKASPHVLDQLMQSEPGAEPGAERWFREWFERPLRRNQPAGKALQSGGEAPVAEPKFGFLRALYIQCSRVSSWDQQMFRRAIAKRAAHGLLQFELNLSRRRAEETGLIPAPVLDSVVVRVFSQELSIERDQLSDSDILWILLRDRVKLYLRLAFISTDLEVLTRWVRGLPPDGHERVLRKVKQRLRYVLAVQDQEQGKAMLRAYFAGETLHLLRLIDSAISKMLARSYEDERTDNVDTLVD